MTSQLTTEELDSRLATLDERLDKRFDDIQSQFDRVNEGFDRVNDRFDKVNEQIDRLATAVVKGFDRIDRTLETKADKLDLQRVYDLLDKIAKQQEIDEDERLVMGHQLERLDRWVHEVADKLGYKLTV